jgi:hypothetical protein
MLMLHLAGKPESFPVLLEIQLIVKYSEVLLIGRAAIPFGVGLHAAHLWQLSLAPSN